MRCGSITPLLPCRLSPRSTAHRVACGIRKNRQPSSCQSTGLRCAHFWLLRPNAVAARCRISNSQAPVRAYLYRGAALLFRLQAFPGFAGQAHPDPLVRSFAKPILWDVPATAASGIRLQIPGACLSRSSGFGSAESARQEVVWLTSIAPSESCKISPGTRARCLSPMLARCGRPASRSSQPASLSSFSIHPRPSTLTLFNFKKNGPCCQSKMARKSL